MSRPLYGAAARAVELAAFRREGRQLAQQNAALMAELAVSIAALNDGLSMFDEMVLDKGWPYFNLTDVTA